VKEMHINKLSTHIFNRFLGNKRSFCCSPFKILVTPSVLPDELIQRLQMQKFQIDQWKDNEENAMDRNELLQRVQGVDGLLCTLNDRIDKQLLDNAGDKLKIVSTISVGFDHIDINECKKRSVMVGNTPKVLTNATADIAIALMLTTARRIPEAIESVKSGLWGTWKPFTFLPGMEVSNSTVGIIGLGRIGTAFAKRLSGFGCKILYTGPREKRELAQSVGAQFVPFDVLLAESDFVVPHCALNQTTRHLFSSEAFSRMKKSAIFINTTRGGIVDQEALYNALASGQIRAAGLDVTTPEPLPTNNPLLSLPNCVVLPHIGSNTLQTRTAMASLAIDNLINGLLGKPLIERVV